nr:DUF4191 family protein [Janibacter hoylei]
MASKSDTPSKPKRENPFKRIASVYRTVKQLDPQVGLWMLLGFVVVLAVGALIGLIFGHVIASLLVALPFAALAAMIVLSRRGERAAFAQMEGQRGASIGGLSALRRGWYYDQEPVAADATKPSEIATAAVVFRALGRPGIVLLGEGPKHRVDKLFAKETKKVARVAPRRPGPHLHRRQRRGRAGPPQDPHDPHQAAPGAVEGGDVGRQQAAEVPPRDPSGCPRRG